MSPLPVVPRERARRDVDDAITFYLSQGAADAALGFVDALEKALDTVGSHPAIGASSWGDELELPGPRSRPLAGHPFAVFHVEHPDHVDVWRVLHMRRDLPTALGEVGSD